MITRCDFMLKISQLKNVFCHTVTQMLFLCTHYLLSSPLITMSAGMHEESLLVLYQVLTDVHIEQTALIFHSFN